MNFNKTRLGESGFSMIELLIVLAMLGVLSAVMFPMLMENMPKWNADRVTKDVSGKLMTARMRALQENIKHGVEFSLGAVDSFKVVQGDTWVDDGGYSEVTTSDEITLVGCTDDRAVFNTNGTASGCAIWINQGGDWERKLSMNTSTGKIFVEYCEDGGC